MSETNGERPPRTPTAEQREQFLDFTAEGMKRNEAAAAVGCTGRQFRALANPEAKNYDAVFAARYEEAKKEHTPNFEERVRDEFVKRAMQGGSDKLLDRLALVTLPELEPHMTKRIEMDGQVNVAVGRWFDLTQLESGEIDVLTRLLEKASKKPKELESGND